MAFVGGLAGNLFNRAKTLPQQLGAAGQLIAQSPTFQNRQSYAANQPVFRTPQGYSAPGYISGQPAGQVLRQSVSTSAPSSGGGGQVQGVATQAPQQQTNTQDFSQYFESQPQYQQPEYDITPYVQQAQSEFNAAVSQFDASSQQAESDFAKQQGEVERAKKDTQYALNQQKEQTLSTTEKNINESRRAAAEIQQGLAARYGAGVSTGFGAQALVGQQAVRNIGDLREQAAYTIRDLEYKAQKTQELAVEGLKQAEIDKNNAIAKAKALRDQAVAEANKNVLMGNKARMEVIQNYVQWYRNQVAEVNRRNNAFVQDMYKKQIDNQLAVEKYKQTVGAYKQQAAGQTQSNFDVNKAYDAYTKGLLTNPKEIDKLEGRLNLSSGSLSKDVKPIRSNDEPLNNYLQSMGINTLNLTKK